MKLKGRVSIITGGGSGIGREISLLFATEGARVVVADIDAEAVEKVARSIRDHGGEALGLHADVTRDEDVRNLVQTALSSFHRIDVLVNNAGICPLTPFPEISLSEWERVLRVNLTSVFLCSQAVLSVMARQRKGCIVNISSLAAKVGGIVVSAHYAAAKAGVIALTKSLAKLYAPYGIRVNAVAPGPTWTPMLASFPEDKQGKLLASIPLGRFAQPREIAQAVLFLACDDSGYITGEVLDVNGGALMD